MKFSDRVRCREAKFGVNRGEDRRDCFIRWRAVLFRNGIPDVPYEIGQQNSPSLGLGVPRSFEEADVQRAVQPSLSDPGAKHLHGVLVSLRGRGNDQWFHCAMLPTA